MTNFCNNSQIIAIILCVLSGTTSMLVSANGMYNHPGGTQPDTVEAAIGTDFNITCFMNPKTFPSKNSTCLHFVIGRTNEELPRENIVVINSITIVYRVINASEQQTEYRCKCGPDAITETKVYVGSLPRPVKDFSCHSYDFDYMICNFTKPHNPILTTYNVSYYNELPNYIYQPKCNYDDRNRVVCNISLSDRYQEMYHFKIESSNALVKTRDQHLTQYFDVNNFEIMIPARPGDNLRRENLTVDSIKLSWQMTNWEKYRLKGLQWEILLQPENSSAIMMRDGLAREHNEMRLRVNNLPYAYWNYKLMFRVRVRHPQAIWSEQFVYAFRTEAKRPQRPPRVDPGSYYIDSTETRITLYWEELLPHEYNGDNFTYVVNSVKPDGKVSDLQPFHQERNLAKFNWRKDLYYHFEIRSKNHMGESAEASLLIIYPKNQRNLKDFTPQAIHNVYHGNNGTYTLTWSKPKNLTELSSFTVFWCYPKRALPNECKESMHFQQVSSDQLNFTTQAQNASEERILNLAVSANYYKFNTGLHWTDCSMDIVNTDLVKMEPELIATANAIKVQWSVERVCPSILDGFNITYCEVANNVSIENATCLHNKIIAKIARKYDKKLTIQNLKPFTTYKVSMLMFWRTKKGQPSDAQVIRTLESAPSPPRQLRVEGITNTTATIKWLEPTHPNGNLRKYIIMLNNDQIEVNASILTYHLENLESFTAYKVYVLAETVERSETSNDVHFTTAIGIPSPPGIGHNNQALANIIQWSKPTKPRGPIDFYEVQVTQLHNEEILRRHTSFVDATSCTFNKFPTCIGAEYKTTVKVRAVNAVVLREKKSKPVFNIPPTNVDSNDENDNLICSSPIEAVTFTDDRERVQKYLNEESFYELLKSDWQTSAIYSCSNSPLSQITTIALIIVAMSLGVMTALYMARKKYNKMANINCTLPAGLETYFTKDNANGFPGDFVSSGSHSLKDTRVAEDQWLQAARMHDFHLRNEHHHLLSSLGSDSSYLGGTNANDSFHDENKLSLSVETANICNKIENTNNEEREQEDINEQYDKGSLKGSIHFSETPASDTVIDNSSAAEDVTNNLVLEQPPSLAILPNNSGYIKQSILQPWAFVSNTESINSPLANNGYITVQNLSQTLEKPIQTGSGYVMQQELQNMFLNKTLPNTTDSLPSSSSSTTLPHTKTITNNLTQFNSNGYTTLENLSKFNNQQQQINEASNNNLPPQFPSNMNATTTDVSSNAAKPGVISGYVTQQDLNLFAQHQHNNY